ncbi:MAG: trypsin-like peptidase domain-containing protein [Flavobacteriales bacterium]|nr:trypsin-like peptidase domain-containing protein [Flavobacteriales bacterium]
MLRSLEAPLHLTTLSFAFLLAWCGAAQAQVGLGGRPIGLSPGAALLNTGRTVVLPAVDRQVLIAEDEQNASGRKGPYRFGYNHTVDIGDRTHGAWTLLRNGDRVWQVTLHCPAAFSVNFRFDRYVVPAGGKVFVYDAWGHTLGAFDASSNGGGPVMGVSQLPGDRITIEYQEPAERAGEGSFHIDRVTHGYRDIFDMAKDFGESGPCNINVICPEGDAWRDQIRSVAIITVGGSGFCSGTLVNNCAEDGTPYFLTANHCLDADVEDWVFRFNWDSPSCDPTENGPLDRTVSGCELLVNSEGTDVALLQLNSVPPEAYQVYYSGWDHSAVPAEQVTGIHHPSGDIKKISSSSSAVTPVTFDDAECWNVGVWNAGTTEQGSSGSGLWNQNKQLVGQLFGGAANCDNSVDDNYGRLDVSWPLLEPYLGAACGDTLGGWEPEEVVELVFDAAITSITNVAALQCGEDSIAPVITLKNNGTVVMTSVTITFGMLGGPSYVQDWTGSLQPGQTVTVPLDTIPLLGGANVLSVTSSSPNGSVDQVAANDTWTINFDASSPAALVSLILTLDNYGSDITWELATETGNVLYEGGPYPDFQNGQLDSTAFCLTNGCYTFTINDFFGNGLCCDDGEGRYVIRDVFGTVYGESDGQYAEQNMNEFCLAGVAVPEVPFPTVTVLPNPSAGMFNLRAATGGKEVDYLVVDAMGRSVIVGRSSALGNAIIDLSERPAGIYHLVLLTGSSSVVKRLVLSQ